jgi:hypothetical protein
MTIKEKCDKIVEKYLACFNWKTREEGNYSATQCAILEIEARLEEYKLLEPMIFDIRQVPNAPKLLYVNIINPRLNHLKEVLTELKSRI